VSNYGDGEETEAGKQHWIRETLDLRREAVDLLQYCTSEGGINNYQTVNVPSPVRELHAATLAYSDQIRPKRGKLREGLWDVDLSEKLARPIRVPTDNLETVERDGEEYDVRDGYLVGEVNRYGEVDGTDVLSVCDTEAWSIIPDELGMRWRANNQVVLTRKVKNSSEYRRNQEVYSVYLPPAACSVLISHFDECLDDMDWLPGGYSHHDAMLDPEGDIHIID